MAAWETALSLWLSVKHTCMRFDMFLMPTSAAHIQPWHEDEAGSW